MLKLLSSIAIFFIITFSLFGYEGIYEGTYTSYTNVGYETGYYVAYIDAAKNINLFIMDDYYNEGQAVRGKLNSKNKFAWTTSGGAPLLLSLNYDNTLTVTVRGNFSGYGYYVSLNPTLSAYNPSSSGLETYVYKLSTNNGNISRSELNRMGSGDSYKLGSGIWRITRCNFTLQHPTYGSQSGRIAGDYIITPNYLYLVGRVSIGNESAVFGIRESRDTSSGDLFGSSINLKNKTISATVSDSSTLGYPARINLSLRLTKSFMDSDFDGVANDIELFNGTKTNKRDTDGDKKSDYVEWRQGTNPTDSTSFTAKITCNIRLANGAKTNRDRIYVIVDKIVPGSESGYELHDFFEMSISKRKASGNFSLPAGYRYRIQPFTGSIEEDGSYNLELYSKYKNVLISRNRSLSFILDGDKDGDGVMDSVEASLKSNSNSIDSDGDGLSDYVEYNLGTSLTSNDTDNDGYDDYVEHNLGSNPKSKKDKPKVYVEYEIFQSDSDPLSMYYLNNNGDYVAEEFTISDLSLILSEIAGENFENGRIFIRNYSSFGDREKVFLRNDSGDSLEVSHVLSPISIKPPALLDASIVSNSYSGQLTENSNGYKLMSSMHTIHASTKGIKLNLVF